MSRTRVYTTLNDDEIEILDKCINQLEFTSRTDYFTACAHVLIYGRNPFEWNMNLHSLYENIELQKKAFLETVQEKAFAIIASKGTGAVISSGILEDIKMEILSRCGRVPEDRELREWLKIYKNLHRANPNSFKTQNILSANQPHLTLQLF